MPIFIPIHALFITNQGLNGQAIYKRFKSITGLYGMSISKKLVMRNAHEQGPTEMVKKL